MHSGTGLLEQASGAAAAPRRDGHPRTGATTAWAIGITGAAQFMAALDNLVVTMALPVIRERLHAGSRASSGR